MTGQLGFRRSTAKNTMPKRIANSEAAADLDIPGAVPQAHLKPVAPYGNDAAPTAPSQRTLSDSDVRIVNEDLPGSLRECFTLLQEAEAQPGETKADEQIKSSRLARIKKLIFALEQMPAAMLDSENMHRAFKHQESQSRKVEVLAREHPEVAEILAENERLREELEKKK